MKSMDIMILNVSIEPINNVNKVRNSLAKAILSGINNNPPHHGAGLRKEVKEEGGKESEPSFTARPDGTVFAL